MSSVDIGYRWDEWLVPEVEPLEGLLGPETVMRISAIVQSQLQTAFKDFALTSWWDSTNGHIALSAFEQNVFGESLPVRISIAPAEFEAAIKREIGRDWEGVRGDRLQQIDCSIKRWQAALERCAYALNQVAQEDRQ